MLKIAICDDEKVICDQLKDILVKLEFEFSEEMEVDIFCSGEKLCEALDEDIYFHIIFLDIEMEIMNGVEVGRRIRNKLLNESTQIVYISGKESYAMELFKLRPLDFIIKPLNYKKIKEVFILALRLIKRTEGIFQYKFEHSTYNLLIKDILYFSSDNRQVKIHTTKGTNQFYGTLKDTYNKVKEFNFIKIHKSYLVSYNHIIKLQYDQVTMTNNEILPISQANRKKVRELNLRINREGL